MNKLLVILLWLAVAGVSWAYQAPTSISMACEEAWQKGMLRSVRHDCLIPAHNGDVASQYYLGSSFNANQHSPVSAFHWFLRASRQGHFDAQIELAKLFIQGRAVPVDLAEAYAWLSNGVASNYDEAVQQRGLLEQKMTETQLKYGRALAKLYLKQYPEH